MPEGLKYIGNNAFAGCDNLVSVTFSENLSYIYDFAFSRCASLTDITLPENLSYIGKNAFAECTSLISITIPDKIEILMGTFFCCEKLTSIILPENLRQIDIIQDGGETVIDPDEPPIPNATEFNESYGTFTACSALLYVDGSNCYQLESIGKNAFLGCDQLQSFSLGTEVPPELDNNVGLYGINAVLKVPSGSVETYRDSGWANYFDTILPLD